MKVRILAVTKCHVIIMSIVEAGIIVHCWMEYLMKLHLSVLPAQCMTATGTLSQGMNLEGDIATKGGRFE